MSLRLFNKLAEVSCRPVLSSGWRQVSGRANGPSTSSTEVQLQVSAFGWMAAGQRKGLRPFNKLDGSQLQVSAFEWMAAGQRKVPSALNKLDGSELQVTAFGWMAACQ